MNGSLHIETQIQALEQAIASQEALRNRALQCLDETKSSLAVTRALMKSAGVPITAEVLEYHHKLIAEACESVCKIASALTELQKELAEFQYYLASKQT